MQVKVNQLTPTRVSLEISAQADEMQEAKSAAIMKLGSSVKVPGFRSGKAPQHLIERQLNANALNQETLEIALTLLYEQALVLHKIRAIGQPEVSLKSFVPFTQLVFVAETDIVRTVKLGEYKGLDVKRESHKVSAAEIETILKRLQEQAAVKKAVKRPAEISDEVVIDFTGSDAQDGRQIEGADGKDYPLILGSKNFIPGFEDKLIGGKAGEHRQIKLKFPQDYHVADLRSKVVVFEVDIKQVYQRTLPKLDDHLAAQVASKKTLAELKEDIKQELSAAKDQQADEKFQNDIIVQLLKNSEVAIPESLIKSEYENIEREQRQQVAYSGQTWNEFLESQKLDEAKYAAQMKQLASDRIKTGLLLGQIAENEKVNLSNDEIEDQLNVLRQRYANDHKMQMELSKPANRRDIKNRLMVEKTLKELIKLNS